MEGHHFMLFKTRREARSALPAKWDVMGNVHWYVPVKVIVVIAPFQRAATPGRRKKDKGTK
jgi:hypothetical protein